MAKPSSSDAIAPFRKGLVWAVSLTFVLIVLGAAVRVAEAGVSCPDWPKCYGQWFPFPAPEGGFISEGVAFSVGQVLLEWGHRLLAAIVGGFVLVAAFKAWRLRQMNKRFFPVALLTILTLLTQVKLGGVTVWLDNVNWSVALHLGNALVFYGVLLLLLMTTLRPAKSQGITAVLSVKILFWFAPIMVFLTMLLGAMVSTAYGGGVCGGLFNCAGAWWPAEDSLQVLHMLHRYAATLTLLTAIAVFLATRKSHVELSKTGRIFFIFTLVQVFLGVLTLYSFSHYAWAYKALSVAHLGWGTVLYTVGLTGVVKLYWGAKDATLRTLPGHP